MYKRVISSIQQYMLIISVYKDLIVDKKTRYNNCEIIFKIKPSEISREYLVKFKILNNEMPKIYILKPNLNDENRDKRPPHMYSLEEGRICLFLPHEISSEDKFVKIIPWISEWLIHYEIWKYTGVWHGHGHNLENQK